MKIPKRTDYLTNYLFESIVSSKTPLAPTLLKGAEGCGKSWVMSLLHSRLDKEMSVIPVWAPYQLSGDGLAQNILRAIEVKEQELVQKLGSYADVKKRKIIVFLDRIDRLFNLTGREKQLTLPKKAKGLGAAYFAQIAHASELRSLLIEKRDRISIVATSEADTRFMDDPEQPFFNFFNVIEVKPFSPDESREFLLSKIEAFPKAVELFKVLEGMSVDSVGQLTEGLISYILLLSSSLIEGALNAKSKTNDFKLLNQMLLIYFNKISPAMESKIALLSYSERALVDQACKLPYQFRTRDVRLPEKTVYKHVLNLKTKGVLDPATPTSTLYYKISSSTFRAWLRYKIFRRPDEIFK